MKYKKEQYELGKNPDISKYLDVRTKHGWVRRAKRGRVGAVTLNDAFLANANTMKISSPAAARLMNKLEPWLRGMDTQFVQAKISTLLGRSYRKHGKMDFNELIGLDLQPEYTLESLVKADIDISKKADEVKIRIPIAKNTIKAKNALVTDYYFEAILVWGDPMAESLRVETEESRLYQYGEKADDCVLQLILPQNNKPWMALLKVSSHEGTEIASHMKHYAMKIIG